jgi:S-adenosylmethionine uptake transporter
MGACVKAASARLPAADLVFYRCAVGAVMIAAWARWRGVGLRTRVPGMHLWRCVSGVGGLLLWFHAISGLPLGTAMTLNATSSVWMAGLVVAAALLPGARRERRGGGDGGPGRLARLVAAVLTGFMGVALVLQPTVAQAQWAHGLMGLMSGLLAAFAYLQLAALGRAGEPEERVVFYFCLAGAAAAWVTMSPQGGLQPLKTADIGLVMSIGVLATVAQWLMTKAYATGTPLVNAALQYLGIAFALVIGVAWFDDPLTPAGLAGMALIVGAGVAATRLRASPG